MALADGKINFIVECNPLLGPQLMDLVKKVKAGQAVPAPHRHRSETDVQPGTGEDGAADPQVLDYRQESGRAGTAGSSAGSSGRRLPEAQRTGTDRPHDRHLLQMTGIHKAFAGVKALDDVDFRLFPGEVHALMGENGAGKSTLIKVLTGVYRDRRRHDRSSTGEPGAASPARTRRSAAASAPSTRR